MDNESVSPSVELPIAEDDYAGLCALFEVGGSGKDSVIQKAKPAPGAIDPRYGWNLIVVAWQRQALERIRRGGQAAIQAVIDRLNEDPRNYYDDLYKLLAEIGGDACIPLFRKYQGAKSFGGYTYAEEIIDLFFEKRSGIIEAGRLDDPAALCAIMAAPVDDERSKRRHRLASTLLREMGPSAADAIIAALQTQRGYWCERLAYHLAKLEIARAAPVLKTMYDRGDFSGSSDKYDIRDFLERHQDDTAGAQKAK